MSSAICTGSHTGVKTDAAMMARFPNLKIIGNFGVGYDTIDVPAAAQARHRHHQHARRADRGGGRHRARAAARHRARVLPGREVAARRTLGQGGRLPPHRLAARPQASASPASAASARPSPGASRRSGCRSATSGASQQAGVSNRYYADLVAMARDVDTLIVVMPGGPATANLVNARGARGAGAARHPHQHGARLGGRRGGADRGAASSRTILAAGLDVFVGEPSINPAFLELDNVTLLPHVGSASEPHARRHGPAGGRQPRRLRRRQAAEDARARDAFQGLVGCNSCAYCTDLHAARRNTAGAHCALRGLASIAVQVAAFVAQPVLGLLQPRHGAGHQLPEARPVVHLEQMRHLVGRDIVEHVGRAPGSAARRTTTARWPSTSPSAWSDRAGRCARTRTPSLRACQLTRSSRSVRASATSQSFSRRAACSTCARRRSRRGSAAAAVSMLDHARAARRPDEADAMQTRRAAGSSRRRRTAPAPARGRAARAPSRYAS